MGNCRNTMTAFLGGIVVGMFIFDVAQLTYLKCENSCKEAFIRTAMDDHEWSKQIWEEMSFRLVKERFDDQ